MYKQAVIEGQGGFRWAKINQLIGRQVGSRLLIESKIVLSCQMMIFCPQLTEQEKATEIAVNSYLVNIQLAFDINRDSHRTWAHDVSRILKQVSYYFFI